MVEPPLELGAVKAMLALALPAVAAPMVGAPGTVIDDGVGFNVAQVERRQAGIGLRNMRERVEHFGGRFDLISVPGRSELDVLLPMKMPGAKR